MPIVAKWLYSLGYYPVLEAMLCNYCDIIGCKWAEQIGRRVPTLLEATAVELKITDIAGVIAQAKSNSYHVTTSYAAMPRIVCSKMRRTTLKKFSGAGIGLLAVDTEQNHLTVVVPSTHNPKSIEDLIARRLWANRVRNRQKMQSLLNGTGGDLAPGGNLSHREEQRSEA